MAEPDRPMKKIHVYAGYKEYLTLVMSCLSTATMVMRRRFNVTLYVHCPSCLFIVTLFLTHTFVQVAYIHLARILQPQQFGCPHNHTIFRKLDTKLRFEPGNVLELPFNLIS